MYYPCIIIFDYTKELFYIQSGYFSVLWPCMQVLEKCLGVSQNRNCKVLDSWSFLELNTKKSQSHLGLSDLNVLLHPWLSLPQTLIIHLQKLSRCQHE